MQSREDSFIPIPKRRRVGEIRGGVEEEAVLKVGGDEANSVSVCGQTIFWYFALLLLFENVLSLSLSLFLSLSFSLSLSSSLFLALSLSSLPKVEAS
jgi:hypothetical protein